LAVYLVAYAGSLRFVYTAVDFKILTMFCSESLAVLIYRPLQDRKTLTMISDETSTLSPTRIE